MSWLLKSNRLQREKFMIQKRDKQKAPYTHSRLLPLPTGISFWSKDKYDTLLMIIGFQYTSHYKHNNTATGYIRYTDSLDILIIFVIQTL